MSNETKIDWCDSCGNNREVRLVKREWLGRYWWCKDCEELFPIPLRAAGAGEYVETIQEGLKQWDSMVPDGGAYAEHEILLMIKSVIDTWYERNEKGDE